MEAYENTLLWKKTLGKEEKVFKKQLECLLNEFYVFRKNASTLANEIARVLPDYTVHDISHVDALWEMADIFLPDNYKITPAEGFVLGGAFILHDLGMGLAAFPNGIEDIKKESIWRDTVAALSKKEGKKCNYNDDSSIDNEIMKIATEKTLRMLHAKKAKELAMISWKDGKGNDIFLIENKELRYAYGDIIGRIAGSHWNEVMDLKSEFPVILGAQGDFPSDWVVDPLKLACIVRIADAIHIDDRRSPILLRAIRKLNKESELHWIFQEKLYKPRVENRKIMFTSKSAFSMNEASAWWLCYDTLKMIDREIKNVDSLLLEEQKETFGIQGVYGIDDYQQIQRLIKVSGWEPIDAKIQVNNVAKLVRTMGGFQLYGTNYLVPLRELIQNAADAIRARRILDNENEAYGDIDITIGGEKGQYYVEIRDNGLGMSQKVLSGVLLDFGESFWGTHSMHEEFPGLEQKEFHSTGKFGIGFFSVFMWGEKVKVISNKYNQSREKTMVLEFMQGVDARPILRKASEDEQVKNGGTIIRVGLSSSIYNNLLNVGFRKDISFDEKVARLCFSLDCNLFLSIQGKRKQLIRANDWKKISANKFYKRLFGKKVVDLLQEKSPNVWELLCHNLKLMYENNREIVGRACLYDNRFMTREISQVRGLVVTDGLEATELFGIIGVIKGETNHAARDVAIPNVTQDAIDKWVIEQVEGMKLLSYEDEKQYEMADYVCALSQQKTDIKLAKWKEKYISYDDIVKIVEKYPNDIYYLVQDAAVSVYESEHKVKIDLADNVFVCSMGMPGILQTGWYNYDYKWPSFQRINGEITTEVVSKQIIRAISEAWEVDSEKVEKRACFSSDDKEYSAVIGKIGNEEIEMGVDILYK